MAGDAVSSVLEFILRGREQLGQQRFLESEQSFEAALEKTIHATDPERYLEAEALIWLSIARRLAHPDAPELRAHCIDLAERALAIERKLYGERHRNVANTLGRLASQLRAIGALDEALGRLSAALEILSSTDNAGELARRTREDLCQTALDIGKHDLARDTATNWLALIPAESHVELIRAHTALGRIQMASDAPLDAISHLSEACELSLSLDRQSGATSRSTLELECLLEEARALARKPGP
jgi:tetratricopeptide (TPR) repeat protein